MKFYVYKVLFFFFCLFLFYQFTIGLQIRSINNKIENYKKKETILKFKKKIREELNKGLDKDKILDNDDALLLKKFIEKINAEIKNAR